MYVSEECMHCTSQHKPVSLKHLQLDLSNCRECLDCMPWRDPINLFLLMKLSDQLFRLYLFQFQDDFFL